MPEDFPELFAFLRSTEFQECPALCFGDDVRDFIQEPIRVIETQLFREFFVALLEFFGAQGPRRLVLRDKLSLSSGEGWPRQASAEDQTEDPAIPTLHEDTSLANVVRRSFATDSQLLQVQSPNEARYPTLNHQIQ